MSLHSRRRCRQAITAFGVAAMFVGACARPQPPTAVPPKVPWTGLLAEQRDVWSAEPGIDLVTGPAVVVRAYLESRALASQMGDIGYVYPGFAHAVAPNDPASHDYFLNPPPVTQNLWPDPSGGPIRHPSVGTGRDHILRIDRSGQQVTAVVCAWTYGTAFNVGDGRYSNDPANPNGTHGSDDGIFTEWLSMTAPAPDAASLPLPPQQGPEPAPADDVFGGWRVVGYASTSPHDNLQLPPAQWANRQADADACLAKAPDPPERRAYLADGWHPRSDFPTLRPYPGWPATGAQ